MEQIGAWGKIRDTGKDGLTVAGLLMFGNMRSITDEFPHYFLEFREKTSRDIGVRWITEPLQLMGLGVEMYMTFILKL